MEKILQDLQNMTLGVCLGIGLVLGAFYYYMFFDDSAGIEQQNQQIQITIAAKKKKLQKVKVELADREMYEKDVAQMASQYKKALTFIPNEFSIAELMRTISNEAKAAGTNIVKIAPNQKVENQEFYEELVVDLKLEGSFSELVMFMSYISKVPRILNVKKIELSTLKSSTEASLLQFSGTISGYRYLEQDVAQKEGKE